MQKITYKYVLGIFLTIFLAISGYFSSSVITQLAEIQKQIASIQLQITELNAKVDTNFIITSSKLLDKQDVKQMIETELKKHILEYHHNIKN